MREASSSPARLERRSILDNVAKRFTTASRMAKIGKWHPHELQHTAASLMLANGIPLRVVSDLLGHASIRITCDVYGHVLTPQRQEAAEVMARFYAAWTPNRSIYSEFPSGLICAPTPKRAPRTELRVGDCCVSVGQALRWRRSLCLTIFVSEVDVRFGFL